MNFAQFLSDVFYYFGLTLEVGAGILLAMIIFCLPLTVAILYAQKKGWIK